MCARVRLCVALSFYFLSCAGGADSIGGMEARVLSTLLNEMDGVTGGGSSSGSGGLLVVGATNRPDMIDAGLCVLFVISHLFHAHSAASARPLRACDFRAAARRAGQTGIA